MPKIVTKKKQVSSMYRHSDCFKLFVAYQNVRGLNFKVSQFDLNSISASYELILLTEI